MDHWKPPQKMIDQYRSWKAMEDYFGIKKYVSCSLRIEMPPEAQKHIAAMRRRILEDEKKRILLN